MSVVEGVLQSPCHPSHSQARSVEVRSETFEQGNRKANAKPSRYVVSRIVFRSCAGRNVVPGASGHSGFVEFIDLVLIFCHEPPMNSRWIGLPLLYPEERPFAITKSPQIRMTVFALIRHEEFDIKRLQGRLIEGQRTFDIADSQNDVVEHRSPLQITSASMAFLPLGTA